MNFIEIININVPLNLPIWSIALVCWLGIIHPILELINMVIDKYVK